MIDALDYILHERESIGGGVEIGGSHLLPLLREHVIVAFESVVIACAIALPPALWLGHKGKGQLAASTAANVGRAVPTIAVLAFASAWLGLGVTNLVFAMVLLALPPIFTNAYVGVRQVDPDVVDAARGMGLTAWQTIGRVQLPLALPLILGGVRTSAVNVVATATLGPLMGVQTLGTPIINYNVHGDAGRLGTGLLIALLAIAVELIFWLPQRYAERSLSPPKTKNKRRPFSMRARTALPLLLLALCFGVAACGDDDNDKSGDSGNGSSNASVIESNPDNSSKTITVGSKNFTEQFILGEIYAQALEAAGYKVKRQLNLGSEQIALKALKSGRVDAYPEYTGTALTAFFKVDTDDIPKNLGQAYSQTKDGFAKENLTALKPTPFTDSNGFAVTEKTSKDLGVKNLSDLKGKSGDLTISGGPECAERTDCLKGLEDVYGLDFKRFVSIDLAKRWDAITSGQSDVGLVFTTDGRIKTDKLVLLKDDKGLFPPYNATFVVRDQAIDDAGPDLRSTIEQVQGDLSTEVMQELNSRVDVDKEKPADVARAYLKESGYIE